MKNDNINEKINKAFSAATPDVLDSVLSDCEELKGKVIFMTDNKKNNSIFTKIAGFTAAAAVALALFAGNYVYSTFYRVASTVSLDVNPSVAIESNKNEKVLAVKAANDDAKVIIGDMDFKGSSLEVTVNALIGSMLKNGYLNDTANSILISVDTDDKAAGEALRHKLAQKVDIMLKEDKFEGAVVSQNISSDKTLEELSAKYEISAGKAQLVNEVVEADPLYTFDDLATLSVNELNLLLDKQPQVAENIEITGKASEKAYIGADKAIEIALASAGAAKDSVRELECELDRENGVMVYEVEFDFEGYDYSYDIGAESGAIVLSRKDVDDDHFKAPADTQNNKPADTPSVSVPPVANGPEAEPPKLDDKPANVPQTDPSDSHIGEARAKEIALAHAGVAAENARFDRIEFDRDDGVESYEIEFYSAGVEYEYDIEAKSGEILKAEKDIDDDTPRTDTEIKPTVTYIEKSAAEQIALTHAGVSSDNVKFVRSEFEKDDGVASYEIEFTCNGVEYEYDIDAQSGAVLKSEKDRNDDLFDDVFDDYDDRYDDDWDDRYDDDDWDDDDRYDDDWDDRYDDDWDDDDRYDDDWDDRYDDDDWDDDDRYDDWDDDDDWDD